jgi:hypothetical protein
MIFGGMISAIALVRLLPGHRHLRTRLAAALGFALLAGFAVGAFLQYATGSLDGDHLLTSLGLALGMAALSLTFLGLESLLGLAGLGVSAVTAMFLGNPLSTLVSGPHWPAPAVGGDRTAPAAGPGRLAVLVGRYGGGGQACQPPAAAVDLANSAKVRGGRPRARCTPSEVYASLPSLRGSMTSAKASASAGGHPC